ncbi:iron-sulfur cluster assembly protein NAR1 PWA37_003245 [Arxiozyma heterogenica]|uniref:iron-sulfur cluster assembly protein NAR1 n=1 Tax=Arxiozyma heterogenica TaxID=278026 RepID=UPI002F1B74CC
MSTLLSEEDLSDFISPALVCTKPTRVDEEPDSVDSNGEYVVGKEIETVQKVTITLSDCLACSGCITSSEEIMLQRQSHTVFLKDMEELQEKRLAVTISPQCRVNMAMYYGLTVQEFDLCFMNFFKIRFNAKYVMGLQIGRNISIQNSIDSVIQWKSQLKANDDHRPRLSGICPGFVIYTEKTKGELVPLLVNIKSPQQITGKLLKAQNPNLYHLCVMACFDKKLEASRPDSVGEVDCVITPKEFLSMLDEIKEPNLKKYLPNTHTANILSLYQELSPLGWDAKLNWSTNMGGSSGGWAYQYVRAMQSLNPDTEIVVLPGRNSNIKEYRLLDNITKKTVASSAELSGFRNIQNLVRNLNQNGKSPRRRVAILKKRGKLNKSENSHNITAISPMSNDNNSLVADPYKTDYIEVNASPGGCINGGGLITISSGKSQRKEETMKLEKMYYESLSMVDPLLPLSSPSHDNSYCYEFHAIESSKDIVTVGSKW